MIAGTGGTTGRPKGVVLTGGNLETMAALTLMSYPFEGRPVYLALAPLTHAAGVLCFPVMALGGEIVVMPEPDLGQFLTLIGTHRVTHAFLPPTLIYMLLDHPGLAAADLTSLQCLWYGAAPMSAARLEQAITRIGPVLGQLFGQTEAPMMISTMAPREHFHSDGSLARERLSSAGRPSPLVTVGIMDADGRLLPSGERGEIVVRGSLVMAGYYQNPAATAEATRNGWHRTGDIGYLDGDNYLFIVDRAKDMIITGGFNVYSAEVEQALLEHPAVQDCAVVGLPDDKWGERVTAVVQPHRGQQLAAGRPARLCPRAARRREIAQAGGDLAGPAPLARRQSAEEGGQVPAAGPGPAAGSRATAWLRPGWSCGMLAAQWTNRLAPSRSSGSARTAGTAWARAPGTRCARPRSSRAARASWRCCPNSASGASRCPRRCWRTWTTWCATTPGCACWPAGTPCCTGSAPRWPAGSARPG